MSKKFVVQINCGDRDDTTEMFVAVSANHPRCRLVKHKQSATRFDSHAVADIVSDYFWEHYWQKNKEQFAPNTREISWIVERKSK